MEGYLIELVKDFFNCQHAEINIWIQNQQQGHWLNEEDMDRFFIWLKSMNDGLDTSTVLH